MQKLHNPEYIRRQSSTFEESKNKGETRGGGVYTLPVVFHVLYNSENQNIPDSVVLSQLEVLNEDYRRLNEDAINTREIFQPIAADMDIEFALATVDPDGNQTNGIIHTYTERENFEVDIFSQTMTLDEVKHTADGGEDAWDPLHYINIWVCNITVNFPAQIFGYSYPPAGLANWPAGSEAPDPSNEGIVIHYTTVGRNNPYADEDNTSDNNLGRALTHEMGHYLGLRHTWGDEFFTDICSEEDGIDDTPICGSGDQYVCDYEANTCDDGTLNDQPDMLENFMDYTKDECYNMFTEGQKSLMRYVIEEIRYQLLENVALVEKTGIKELSRAWPNPAKNKISFQLPGKTGIYQYEIRTILGELIAQGQSNVNCIDVSNFQSGIYMLSITQEKSQSIIRFMVK